MKDNKCPFLEKGLYCTHKSAGRRNNVKNRPRCRYFSHEMCPLLKESKSLLRMALKCFRRDSSGDVRQ